MVDVLSRLNELSSQNRTSNTISPRSISRFRQVLEREVALNNQALTEFNARRIARDAETQQLTDEFNTLAATALNEEALEILSQAANISAPTFAAFQLGLESVRASRADTAREALAIQTEQSAQQTSEELSLLRLQQTQSQNTVSQELNLAKLRPAEETTTTSTFSQGLETARLANSVPTDTSIGSENAPDFTQATDANGNNYNFNDEQIELLNFAYESAKQSPIYALPGFGEDYAVAVSSRLIQESRVNNAAVGSSGEIGIAQILPSTRPEAGLPANRLLEPREEILGSIRYDEVLFNQLENQGAVTPQNPNITLSQLTSAYNGGAGGVARFAAQGLPYSTATAGYVQEVVDRRIPELRGTQIAERPSNVVRRVDVPAQLPEVNEINPPVEGEITIADLRNIAPTDAETEARFLSQDQEGRQAILNLTREQLDIPETPVAAPVQAVQTVNAQGERINPATLERIGSLDDVPQVPQVPEITEVPVEEVETVDLEARAREDLALLQIDSLEPIIETFNQELVRRANQEGAVNQQIPAIVPTGNFENDLALLNAVQQSQDLEGFEDPSIQQLQTINETGVQQNLTQDQVVALALEDFNAELVRRANQEGDVTQQTPQIIPTGDSTQDLATLNQVAQSPDLEGFQSNSVQLLDSFNRLGQIQDPTLPITEETVQQYALLLGR